MKALILICAILLPFEALATPAQVIIIRHAEKQKNGNDLSARGFQRADALVGLFERDSDVLKFGLPAAIYAMEPRNSGTSGETSLRAIETIQPLASALNLPIHSDYVKSDYAAMVQEIMTDPAYNGRMVLICWEHKVIPPMAEAFGASQVPSSWGKGVYDRLWLLTFKNGQVAFADLPQRLLPGDSNN